MRRQLLELIICPKCQNKYLEIQIQEENEIEIRQGLLMCHRCNTSYDIDDGIPNLLVNPTEEILSEQRAWDILVNKVENTDELMLSLPDALDEHRSGWASMAVNFHYMWSQLELLGNERVLDLGSGRCWTTRYFAREGCYAVGIDIVSTKYVGLRTADIFIEHDKIYFERLLSDMNNTPFRDESFDLIFVAATIHHSSNLDVTMEQIKRLLKPGGKLILINEPIIGLFQHKLVEGEEVEYGVNEHVYWFFDYISAIRRAGMAYRVYPYIGSYHSLLAKSNSIIKKHWLKHRPLSFVWRPLVYCQLIFSGGILNLIADKSTNKSTP